MREHYSLTFKPLSIARHSFIQLSKVGRRGENEDAQISKRGFKPGLSRLRIRRSTAELPCSPTVTGKGLQTTTYKTQGVIRGRRKM